jgi:hypothetical protein
MQYRVIWHYVANHGVMDIEAQSAAHAAKQCYEGFSEDFRKRGEVYVFPMAGSEVYSGHEYQTELKQLKG